MDKHLLEASSYSVPLLTNYYRDFKTSISSKEKNKTVEEAVKSLPRASLPAKTYQTGQNNDVFQRKNLLYEGPQYDLSEIARVRDIESLVNTSAERHIETALQSGWDIDGADEEAVNYVKDRIFDFELVTGGVTMYKILNMLIDQLVTYGTAFLVVKRDASKSRGNKIRFFGKELDPISSWAIADAPTMSVAENKGGQPIGWKQIVSESHSAIAAYGGTEKEKKFSYDEVFVFTRHKQAGRVFGRSLFLTVLDDIVSLRELEDLSRVITQKFANPLFQYIVGTKERPAGEVVLADGNQMSEVELAQMYLENMPIEGGFVTSERHEVKLIGTEGKVLDLTPYIAHFKARVQEGVRMSNTALGTSQGGSPAKSTAQTQVKSMQDSSQYLQDIVVDGFKMFFAQIMMEGDFDVTRENLVTLSFSAPDKEEKRAHENHILGAYQGGLITHGESRRAINKRPLTKEEEKDTYAEREKKIQKELAKHTEGIKAEAQVKTAEHNVKAKEHEVNKELAKTETEHAKVKTEKAKAEVARITSKIRPQNQHGRKATKTRIKKNDSSEIGAMWDAAMKTAILHTPVPEEPTMGYSRVTSPYIDSIMAINKKFLDTAIYEGTLEARKETGKNLLIVTNDQSKAIMHSCRKMLKKILIDCVERINKDNDYLSIVASFSQLKDNILETTMDHLDFAFNAAKVACMHNADIKEVTVTDASTELSVTISTMDFCHKALESSDASILIKAASNE